VEYYTSEDAAFDVLVGGGNVVEGTRSRIWMRRLRSRSALVSSAAAWAYVCGKVITAEQSEGGVGES
jgi:hypothetical protein